MSVLTCPVCQGAMREVNREGILIDVCTQCRGVWLDRGELEKLAGFLGGGAPAQMAPPMDAPRGMPQQMPPQHAPYPDEYAYRNRERRRDWDDDDDDDRRYRGDDRGGRQRSGMGRFLDFFD